MKRAAYRAMIIAVSIIVGLVALAIAAISVKSYAWFICFPFIYMSIVVIVELIVDSREADD